MNAAPVDVDIDVENQHLRDPLLAMVKLVREHAGFIAPGLRLMERAGSLWIERPRDAPPVDQLVAVPAKLLVPIEDLVWADHPGELGLATPARHLSSEQAALLEQFLAIYNASGKLKQVADFPVAVFARDGALLDIVTRVKPETQPLKASLAQLFLSTRQVSEWINPGDESRSAVLMPVMDFLNHHHTGDTFRMADGCLAVTERHVGESEECVSSYGGQRDPLDLLIGHGYVDRSTPFAASLPVRLALPGLGRLLIDGLNLGANHKLNPPRVSFAPGEARLSHAVFDRQSSDSLLAALTLPVRALARRESAAPVALDRALEQLADRLLEANLAVLADFRTALGTHPDSPTTVAQFLAASEIYEANLRAALRS